MRIFKMRSELMYITPSRTIEVILDNDKIWFIYNYEGKHYRVFNSKNDI